jgi:Collagen triple helix repeat (20 copies)
MKARISISIAAAVVALAVVAGGAAASGYFISSIKQISPSVRAQLRGARGPRGFRGAQGVQGPQGAQGLQGAQGPQGVAGAAGTAPAYAIVNSDGFVVEEKNVTGVSHTSGSGIYCIVLASGITADAVVVSLTDVSPNTGTPNPGASAYSNPDSPDCATGELEVVTTMLQLNAGQLQAVPADEGFTVALVTPTLPPI